MDKYIGRLLDNRYEILEIIGTGGMAVVYKARCHRLNRLVAIKILKDEYSQDEEFRRRFHAESQAVAMLSHPNIVSVYDVSTSNDADFIVMELIDGISLKQYMEKKGVLNWKETLHFSIQIAKALEHAHSRGIIHRDIKPHNVMVLKNGSVKVADFGIARVVSKSNTLTKEALGSVHYISPEQAKGGRVDNRSDIYSLGVVMYEMMTGRPPYDGDTPVAVAIQHINGKAVMPSAINPNIPGGLEQIIMKAMAQASANRYTTATAMLYDMDEFRKVPTILFDHNNENTDIDDAPRILQMNPQERTQPQTVAEKTANRQSPARERTAPLPRTTGHIPQQPQQRRRKEVIVEEKEDRSRVATVAVVICSLVAIVAIAVFIAAIVNGGLFESGTTLVTVPNFKNMTLTEAEKNLDFVIKVQDRVYSEEFEAGKIISQSPEADRKVSTGTTISVVLSMGKQPVNKKTMDNLVQSTPEDAESFLNGKDMNLQFLRRYETSDVPEGLITRTEPAAGEELKDGQTVVLWISTGPEIKTAWVSKVTNLTVDMAIKVLKASGFDNVTVEQVDNIAEAGTVIMQSVAPQTKVDVNTEIILTVSNGPAISSEPTEPPIETMPETWVSKVITVYLPDDIMEEYTLAIWRDSEILEERQIPRGTVSTQFEVYGEGKVEFTFTINGAQRWPMEVDFEEDTANE